MYGYYEYTLMWLHMSIHEVWLYKWIIYFNFQCVWLVYVVEWDPMCTLHKWASEGVVRVVYIWYELNGLWLKM